MRGSLVYSGLLGLLRADPRCFLLWVSTKSSSPTQVVEYNASLRWCLCTSTEKEGGRRCASPIEVSSSVAEFPGGCADGRTCRTCLNVGYKYVCACVRLPATCISTMLIAFRLLGGQRYGFSQDPLRLTLFFLSFLKMYTLGIREVWVDWLNYSCGVCVMCRQIKPILPSHCNLADFMTT